MADEQPDQTPPTFVAHVDPTQPPQWLIDSAKTDPSRVGWMVSGYLAGVEAARHAGACGASHPDTPARCGLHYGHLGVHSTVGPLVWEATA